MFLRWVVLTSKVLPTQEHPSLLSLPRLLPDKYLNDFYSPSLSGIYIICIRHPDPHHEGPGGVETLFMDLRDHDVLQLIHHLMEALLTVRARDSPSKVLTKGIVEIKVKLLRKQEIRDLGYTFKSLIIL